MKRNKPESEENINPKNISPLTVSFIAFLPIFLIWIYKVVISPRPFHVFYYDPETIYFYGGSEILHNFDLSNFDNPGIPVYLISFLIQKILRIDVFHYDSFRLVFYATAIILYFLAFFLIARYLILDLPFSLKLACLWFYFLAPQSLEYINVVSPELLFFPFCMFLVITLFGGKSEIISWPRLTAASTLIGLCVSLKFTCLSFVPALLLSVALSSEPLKTRFAKCIFSFGCVAITFMAMTMPFVPSYTLMFSRLGQFTLHKGLYGAGAVGLPTADRFGRNVVKIISSSKTYLPFLAVIVSLLGYLFFRDRDRLRKGKLRFILVFLVSSLSIQYLAVVRSENIALRYLLPSAAIAVGAFAFILSKFHNYIPDKTRILIVLLISGLLVQHAVSDIRKHDRRISDNLGLEAELSVQLDQLGFNPQHHTIIYTWRLPKPSYALRYNIFRENFYSDIEQVYPQDGHWNPWMKEISLPRGSDRWNFAVVDKKYVDIFPAPSMRVVGSVRDYLIIVPDEIRNSSELHRQEEDRTGQARATTK